MSAQVSKQGNEGADKGVRSHKRQIPHSAFYGKGNQKVTSDNPEATYDTLEKYGYDMVERARQQKLDPVIGRDDEIRNVVRILSRKTKNNPVLIGEPGVGKTAVVEDWHSVS